MPVLTWKIKPFPTNRSPARSVGTFLPVSFYLEGDWEGVGHSSEKAEKEVWWRGQGGAWAMVYDLQGEPGMSCFSVGACPFQIPCSPVPSRGMAITSLSIKSCLCPFSLPQRRRNRKSTESSPKMCSGPRTEAAGGTVRRKLVQVLVQGGTTGDKNGKGGGSLVSEDSSRLQPANTWHKYTQWL